jgi:glycerophosphoryl diester phosphodiesterase
MKALKILRRVVIVILSTVAIMFLLPRHKSTKDNPFVKAKSARPLAIAHGGGNKEFPDNTLEAYFNAYSIDPGIMLETDVSITKDGVVILSHDVTLNRKTNVSGNISDWNYTDLISDEVNFGYENTMPYISYENKRVYPTDITYPDGVKPRHETKFLATTLEELIKTFPASPINVEIKQRGETGLKALAAVVGMLADLDGEYNTFSRVVIASFHDEIYEKIKEYKKEYTNLKYSPNESGILPLYVMHWIGADFIFREPVAALQLPTSQYGFPLDTPLFIGALHRHNIAAHYWTVNDPEEMRRLARNGADGIMTDYPTLLDRVLDEMYDS